MHCTFLLQVNCPKSQLIDDVVVSFNNPLSVVNVVLGASVTFFVETRIAVVVDECAVLENVDGF